MTTNHFMYTGCLLSLNLLALKLYLVPCCGEPWWWGDPAAPSNRSTGCRIWPPPEPHSHPRTCPSWLGPSARGHRHGTGPPGCCSLRIQLHLPWAPHTPWFRHSDQRPAQKHHYTSRASWITVLFVRNLVLKPEACWENSEISRDCQLHPRFWHNQIRIEGEAGFIQNWKPISTGNSGNWKLEARVSCIGKEQTAKQQKRRIRKRRAKGERAHLSGEAREGRLNEQVRHQRQRSHRVHGDGRRLRRRDWAGLKREKNENEKKEDGYA